MLDWTNDKIIFTNVKGTENTEQYCTLEELRDVLKAPPYGLQEVFVQVTLDLTDLDELFISTGITLPAGSIVKYAALLINETVVADGGTTAKVALGVNDGDVDAFGISDDLAADTEFAACLKSLIASSTTVDVCAVLTDGSDLGDTNISAGNVTVAIIYDKPVLISNFS